jgi:tellurite resistance protein TerC
MDIQQLFWAAFAAVFFIVFSVDMYVTRHRDKKISIKTALLWTGVWISTALLYGAAIFIFYPNGNEKAFEFLTGYLTEYSLSVDNLFVFIMIFSVMGISEKSQPRMLKIGIMLSIFFRILFILFGIEMIHRFHFVIYIFGVILLYTAYKMMFMEDDEIDPEKNFFYRNAQKYFRIEIDKDAEKMFIRKDHKLYATTLFLIFLLIGTTDVVFALDSIPAIIGITTDTFIVITSNVFAVLGLVSLFFALEGIMHMFRFLKTGVAIILFFVAVKMLISGFFEVPIIASLAFIILTLLISIIASVIIKEEPETEVVEIEEESN